MFQNGISQNTKCDKFGWFSQIISIKAQRNAEDITVSMKIFYIKFLLSIGVFFNLFST